MKLFIKNLPKDITEEELNKLISDYGNVVTVKILTDPDSGESRGCAFVEMGSREEALYVMKRLNGETLEENRLIIETAHPKKHKDFY
jgi:RNA recognition motif-containing protein